MATNDKEERKRLSIAADGILKSIARETSLVKDNWIKDQLRF